MDPARVRRVFRSRNPHELILACFKWGKYTIIYGSIFFLTVLGIIVWLFGTLNLFFLVGHSAMEWGFSRNATTTALQQLETDAISLLDFYLLSVVLFIVAIGLYGIFIRKEEGGIRLPVNIKDISQLERYLFGTIVAMLLVYALDKILYPEEVGVLEQFLPIGMICAVVLVISIYLAVQRPGDQQQKTTSKKR